MLASHRRRSWNSHDWQNTVMGKARKTEWSLLTCQSMVGTFQGLIFMWRYGGMTLRGTPISLGLPLSACINRNGILYQSLDAEPWNQARVLP